MMNRRIVILTVLVFITILAQGQINIDYTKKLEKAIKEQGTTELAINGSVVVIKQSYQVKNKKTGSVYGRSGRNDFGHRFTLGVKTAAGLILTEEALKPWLYDSAYKKVERDYEPQISLTEVREIKIGKKTNFSHCPLKLGNNQPNGVWVANSEKATLDDLEIDSVKGYKDGSLVWFTTEKDLDEEPELEIKSQVTNQKIDALLNGDDFFVNAPANNDVVLGGILVCPSFLGGGRVVYRLVGITIKEGKSWKLITPFVGFSYEKRNGDTEVRQNGDSGYDEDTHEEDPDVELTPIENEKKKNKKSKK